MASDAAVCKQPDKFLQARSSTAPDEAHSPKTLQLAVCRASVLA